MNNIISTNVNFLEANTNSITLEELTEQCVVPTWANQELTISHQDFISTVHDAACNVFAGETINNPEIRVSHIVRGRTANSLHKRTSELLESEKTQFYFSLLSENIKYNKTILLQDNLIISHKKNSGNTKIYQ